MASELRPPPERVPVSKDRLGAYLLYGFVLNHGGGEPEARALSRAWRSDQLDYFHFGGDRVAARWRVFFDSASLAEVFEQRLFEYPERFSTLRDGPAVVVTVGVERAQEWLLTIPGQAG